MEKIRLVTGLRPTGKLHVGHCIGALKNLKELQDSGKYDCFVFIADTQALTDNADNPEKIKTSVKELMLDFLACGLDPNKCTLFVQSQVPQLTELTMYYLNLVTLARLERNPTVKTEIKERGFGSNIPVGFLTYPVSQASDITAFEAKVVPCGEDQQPLVEQCREIVRSFNRIYGEVLVEPKEILSSKKNERRLVGTDGNAKMSKSLNNCIYLSDSPEEIKKKVMSMYTDPNHIRVEDKGDTKNNPVFIYLDVFGKDKEKIAQMKEHYERGGLGDVVCKKYLNEIMQEFIKPIREKREQLEKDFSKVEEVFKNGSVRAKEVAQSTLEKVRKAMQLNYFD